MTALGANSPLGSDSAASVGAVRRWLGRHSWLAVLVVALLWIGVGSLGKAAKSPSTADPTTTDAMVALIETGQLAMTTPQGPVATRAVAPGYPALVSLLTRLDRDLGRGFACLRQGRTDCSASSFRLLLLVQGAVAVAWIVLSYGLALSLSGSRPVAALTLLLCLMVGRYVDFAYMLRPAVFSQTLILAGLALLLRGRDRASLVSCLGAGGLLGLAALFESTWLLLLPTAALAAVLAPASREGSRPPSVHRSAALACLLGGILVVTPWMWRNTLLFSDPALDTVAYGQLAVRAAYTGMPLAEQLGGLLLWTPAIGDILLARFMSPSSVTDLLALPDSGTMRRATEILIAVGPCADTPLGAARCIARDYIVASLPSHALTTLGLTWRGVWGGSGLVGIIAVLLLPAFLRIQAATGRLPRVFLVAAPVLAMVLINALLTPNPWYTNLAMAFVLCYVVSDVAGSI